MNTKKCNEWVLPGQLWMLLQCLDSVADPSALQSLPPFAGRGLVQERERCWVPPDRLQGDQEFHCEYPPCTGTPNNDQHLLGNWCKKHWVSTLYFVGQMQPAQCARLGCNNAVSFGDLRLVSKWVFLGVRKTNKIIEFMFAGIHILPKTG